MKDLKYILASIILVIPLLLFARTKHQLRNIAVFQSSYTITNETTANISNAEFIHTVIIGTSTAGGTLILYDSEGNTTTQFANIDLNTKDCYHFDVALSSGLTYTTSGNSGGVTMTYR